MFGIHSQGCMLNRPTAKYHSGICRFNQLMMLCTPRWLYESTERAERQRDDPTKPQLETGRRSRWALHVYLASQVGLCHYPSSCSIAVIIVYIVISTCSCCCCSKALGFPPFSVCGWPRWGRDNLGCWTPTTGWISQVRKVLPVALQERSINSSTNSYDKLVSWWDELVGSATNQLSSCKRPISSRD